MSVADLSGLTYHRPQENDDMNIAVAEQQIVEVILPKALFQKLKAEAEIKQQATGALAGQVIESWLTEKDREMVTKAELAAFVEEYAGTEFDLDPELEAAGVEFMLSQPE